MHEYRTEHHNDRAGQRSRCARDTQGDSLKRCVFDSVRDVAICNEYVGLICLYIINSLAERFHQGRIDLVVCVFQFFGADTKLIGGEFYAIELLSAFDQGLITASCDVFDDVVMTGPAPVALVAQTEKV